MFESYTEVLVLSGIVSFGLAAVWLVSHLNNSHVYRRQENTSDNFDQKKRADNE